MIEVRINFCPLSNPSLEKYKLYLHFNADFYYEDESIVKMGTKFDFTMNFTSLIITKNHNILDLIFENNHNPKGNYKESQTSAFRLLLLFLKRKQPKS